MLIPSPGAFRPTVVDKGWPIESIGTRRTFDSGVRARYNSRKTSPGEGIRTQEMRYMILFIVTFFDNRVALFI